MMSTLFADAMRAAVYANASGYYESPEQAAYRLEREAEWAKLCRDEVTIGDGSLYCELKPGHRGQFHIAMDDDLEIRWRKTGRRGGPMSTWSDVKEILGTETVTLGPSISYQLMNDPGHVAMVLARYRAAAALIGNAASVVELGCGEGFGAGILAAGREWYLGYDNDRDVFATARAMNPDLIFLYADATGGRWAQSHAEAVVALDVLEHIPPVDEAGFWATVRRILPDDEGVCVIGVPSASFDHLASPASRAGHVNTQTHAQLMATMRREFKFVQSFGMQDTALHLGHPDARHYHLAVGVGRRVS